MDIFVMDEVMNLIRLYISMFNSLKALASKHVPCLWMISMLWISNVYNVVWISNFHIVEVLI